MNKYDDLELSILGCFLQKPSLIDKAIVEDKHFIKHKKIWLFFKAVYKKFGTLDINIMYSISKNKYRIIEYIVWISEYYGFPNMCMEYQKQLISLYNQNKKDKWVIERIYELSNDLLVGNVDLNNFRSKVDEIYNNSNKIFEEED